MSSASNVKPARRARRTRPAAAAALATVILIAGCGTAATHSGSGHSGSHAQAASTATDAGTDTASPSTVTAPSPDAIAAAGLAFARCMRQNGVTNFPDPTPGRGLVFDTSPGKNLSPAFRSAQSKCQKLLPLAEPGGGAPPSKQTMAKLLRIATCMRAHGIHQFPDPLYTRPAHLTPGEYQDITDFDGATLLFPAGMNLQAPAYRRALGACGAPPLGLPH